jgi:MFS family permease
VLIASFVQFFTIPIFGLLSDVVGRRPVYLGGAASLAVFAFPYFWLVDTGNPMWIGLATIVSLVIVAAMYGPQAAFFSELFGTDVRYTGASIGYQLASPLAGGLAPMISMSLLEWAHGRSWPIAIYLIVLSAITLVSVWLAAETHQSQLEAPKESA